MSAQPSNRGLTMSRSAQIRDQRRGVARTHPIADAYLLWRLFKEGLRRITGVPTDASLLTTLFAIGVLAYALRRLAAPLLKKARPKLPSFPSTAMAGAAVWEIPGSIGGLRTHG